MHTRDNRREPKHIAVRPSEPRLEPVEEPRIDKASDTHMRHTRARHSAAHRLFDAHQLPKRLRHRLQDRVATHRLIHAVQSASCALLLLRNAWN